MNYARELPVTTVLARLDLFLSEAHVCPSHKEQKGPHFRFGGYASRCKGSDEEGYFRFYSSLLI